MIGLVNLSGASPPWSGRWPPAKPTAASTSACRSLSSRRSASPLRRSCSADNVVAWPVACPSAGVRAAARSARRPSAHRRSLCRPRRVRAPRPLRRCPRPAAVHRRSAGSQYQPCSPLRDHSPDAAGAGRPPPARPGRPFATRSEARQAIRPRSGPSVRSLAHRPPTGEALYPGVRRSRGRDEARADIAAAAAELAHAGDLPGGARGRPSRSPVSFSRPRAPRRGGGVERSRRAGRDRRPRRPARSGRRHRRPLPVGRRQVSPTVRRHARPRPVAARDVAHRRAVPTENVSTQGINRGEQHVELRVHGEGAEPRGKAAKAALGEAPPPSRRSTAARSTRWMGGRRRCGCRARQASPTAWVDASTRAGTVGACTRGTSMPSTVQQVTSCMREPAARRVAAARGQQAEEGIRRQRGARRREVPAVSEFGVTSWRGLSRRWSRQRRRAHGQGRSSTSRFMVAIDEAAMRLGGRRTPTSL